MKNKKYYIAPSCQAFLAGGFSLLVSSVPVKPEETADEEGWVKESSVTGVFDDSWEMW